MWFAKTPLLGAILYGMSKPERVRELCSGHQIVHQPRFLWFGNFCLPQLPLEVTLIPVEQNQKNPRVRKIRVRNSGAGKGCANFMDARKKCVLSAGKTHVHKIPRFRGGVFWVLGGGGECRFYFYGRADFSDKMGSCDPRGLNITLQWLHLIIPKTGRFTGNPSYA